MNEQRNSHPATRQAGGCRRLGGKAEERTHAAGWLARPGGSPLPVDPFSRHAAQRHRANPMPISVPNYNCRIDRLQFGMLIGITSES